MFRLKVIEKNTCGGRASEISKLDKLEVLNPKPFSECSATQWAGGYFSMT